MTMKQHPDDASSHSQDYENSLNHHHEQLLTGWECVQLQVGKRTAMLAPDQSEWQWNDKMVGDEGVTMRRRQSTQTEGLRDIKQCLSGHW
jgi:hypothetical protein